MYHHRPTSRRHPGNRIAPPLSSLFSLLPVELFVKIFLLTSPGATRWSTTVDEVGQDRKYWVRLMAVCTLWREIIKNSTVFWTNIHVGRDLRWLELSLSRTKGACNIDISIPVFVNFKSVSVILGPYRDQIRSLAYLDGNCASGEFAYPIDARTAASLAGRVWQPTLPLTGASLRSLSLVSKHLHGVQNPTNPGYGCPAIHMSLQQLPRLRTLSLSGFTVCGNSPDMFSRLVSLSLTGRAGIQPRSTMSNLIAILQPCVSLQDIAFIDYLGVLFHPDISQGSGPVVSLPSLRNLKIEDVCTPNIPILLSHMTLGAHVNISIKITHTDPSTYINTSMVNVLPGAQWKDRLAILRCVDRIKVFADYYDEGVYKVTAMQDPATHADGTSLGTIQIVGRDASGDAFRKRHAQSAGLMRDLPKIFTALHRVTTLICHIYVKDMYGTDSWLAVLPSYRELRTLVIDEASCNHNVAALGEVLGGLTGTVVCPRLEYLWLRNMTANRDIMETTTGMVKWRAGTRAYLPRLRLELVTWPNGRHEGLTRDRFYAYQPGLLPYVGRCEMKLWDNDDCDEGSKRFELAEMDISANLDEFSF